MDKQSNDSAPKSLILLTRQNAPCWDHINFEKGTIRVAQQLVQPRGPGTDSEYGSTKNGKDRNLMPAGFVMDVLRQHKEKQEEMKKAAGDLWNEGDFPGLVFTNPDGSQC